MIRVLVQVMGPNEGSGASMHWITIGAIENPPSVDLTALRPQIHSIVRNSPYQSPTPAIRLSFEEDGQTYMKLLMS